MVLFTFDTAFPLAMNFLVTAAFTWILAGGKRLALCFGDDCMVLDCPLRLHCNNSGLIFGRTPPDAIVTCFKS